MNLVKMPGRSKKARASLVLDMCAGQLERPNIPANTIGLYLYRRRSW